MSDAAANSIRETDATTCGLGPRDGEPDWDLVASHVALVARLSRSYRGYRVSSEDLESEGILGLVEASRRFNPAEGVRFSTYASWWILKKIREAAASQSTIVRVPRHRFEFHRRVRVAEAEMTALLARSPTAEEIAARAGVAVAMVHRIRAEVPRAVSLDEPASPQSKRLLGEVIAQTSLPAPDDAAIAEDRRASVAALVPSLPERLRDVVLRRYGLDGDPPSTLADIASDWGVSRERVHQLERAAIRRLRRLADDSSAASA